MSNCPHAWEVEALRDGRLGGDARRHAERHAESCASCSTEKRAFTELAEKLRSAAPEVDEVGLRRLRNRVLARAHGALDEGAAQTEPRARSRALWLGAAAIAALGLIGGGGWLLRSHATHSALRTSTEVATEIDPSSDAAWSRVWETSLGRDIEHVRLWRGSLTLRNRRQVIDRPLVVSVPDGHIEDIGTVFYVLVRDHRTVDIAVTEGRVRFTPNVGEAVVVEAGTEWRAPIEPAPSASAAQGPSVPPSPPKNASIPAPSAPRLDKASVGESSNEDAAYLHILALEREGRHDEASLAAAEYLARFPNGFRRVEVEQIRSRVGADGRPDVAPNQRKQ